jgi:hypothetical protein
VLWKPERSPHDDGLWFVAVRSSQVIVLAPPGVALTRRGRGRFERTASGVVHENVEGWRMATWFRPSEGWPRIDRQLPETRRDLSTKQVLRILPEGWHESVWLLMVDQLEAAAAFGRAGPDREVNEDLARAGMRTTSWLQAELLAAFPARRSQVMEVAPRGRRAASVVPARTTTRFDQELHAWLSGPARPGPQSDGILVRLVVRLESWARHKTETHSRARSVARVLGSPVRRVAREERSGPQYALPEGERVDERELAALR